MPFIVDTSKVQLNVENAYANSKGNTECVAFIQIADLVGGGHVPRTGDWRKGIYVKGLAESAIKKGTVIATFDDAGNYPGDNRHAAVFISQNDKGIVVYDQWNSQKMVKQRTLYFKDSENRTVDNGNFYWIVETAATLGAGLTSPESAPMFNSPFELPQ